MVSERPAASSDFTPGLVSIVMAARDAARWIGDALHSIAAQHYPSIEVLVVDDGSRDETARIAQRFAGELTIHVIRETGRGPAAARNRGLDAATGEFLQFLDADDVLEPDKIERQVEFIQATGATVVWGAYQQALDGGEGLARAQRVDVHPRVGDDVEADLISANGFIPLAAMLIRRSGAMAAVRMAEHMHVLEDIQYHFSLLAAGATYREHKWVSGLVVREHDTPSRASRAPRSDFWTACVANAVGREEAWRENGSLDVHRARILASIYVYAARELATAAPDASRDAALRAIRVDKRYYDFVAPRLRVPARLFGLHRVERIADIGRRIRGAFTSIR